VNWRCREAFAHDRGFASAGRGEDAAAIAAVLTERGLGRRQVDLDARLDQFRRDRSPRGISARGLASAGPPVAAGEEPQSERGSTSTGVMLALLSDRVARTAGNGSFVLANGRVPRWIRPPRWRARLCRGRRMTGTAAQGAFYGGAITQDEIELRFADRLRRRTRFRSIAARWRCGRGARKHCMHHIVETPLALQASCRLQACWPMG